MPSIESEDWPGHFPVNYAKRAERAALLAAHPELVRRIAVPPLREIVQFMDFRCATGSSIARDQAIARSADIAGSDIDVGLVVTADPVVAEDQRLFVEELRRQGFTAYDEREVEAAQAANFERLANMRDLGLRGLLAKNVPERFALIDFATIVDLEGGVAPPHMLRVFMNGYSIVHGTVGRMRY